MEDSPSFLEIPGFFYNTAYDKPKVVRMPKISSMNSAVSIELRRLVADRQTDTGPYQIPRHAYALPMRQAVTTGSIVRLVYARC